MSIRFPLKALGLSLGLAGLCGALSAGADEPQRGARRLYYAPAVASPAPQADTTPAEPAPVEEPVAEEPQATAQLPDNVELIQERFPNGAIKVERYVTQDVEGNYINHGPWVQYNQAGKKVGAGEYRYGKQHGKWLRWFAEGEGELFAASSYKQFKAPFISEVTLVDGQLQGTWTIWDSRKLKCSEWEFENGHRHGKAITYYPNGHRASEVDYREGEVDGKVLAWDQNDQLVQDDTYIQGRKHANKVLFHSPGKKRAEGWVLYARAPLETGFDWWNGAITTTPAVEAGADQKHGLWTWWFPNGQKYSEGRYLEDQPVGPWVFWHSNGQKNMQGEYIAGVQTGKWTWWKEDGTVMRVEEYGTHAWTDGDEGEVEGDLEAGDEVEMTEIETDEDIPEVGTLRTPSFE